MMQQKKNSHNNPNGYANKDVSRMSFQKRDNQDNRSGGGNGGKGSNKANGTSSNFRTDSAISSSRPSRERVLQPWVAPSGSEDIDMSLEKSTSGRPWDQFAANERQFGIKTTYDENIYTTVIDKSHPQYKERLAKADRTAKEIESSATTTAHHAEERQMNYAGGDDVGDEEEKYSGVKRQEFPALTSRETKYTPPARRAPAGVSTVKGAPVDPAIISSQLRTQKPVSTAKIEDNKAHAVPTEVAQAPTPVPVPEVRLEGKTEGVHKPAEARLTNQASIPLKPAAAANRTISPRAHDGPGFVPNATATVEHDVLKEFKNFAEKQRQTVDKVRHTKAKVDKEIKLIELKRFAASFKLPTPVPPDLIPIIAKDPTRQREIQEKSQRDAQEVAKRKAEEAAAKEREKKEPVTTSTEPQQNAAAAVPPENRTSRITNAPAPAGASSSIRNQGRVPPNYSYSNNRSGQQHMPPSGRQGGLTHRIRESQKSQAQEMRLPPTGPANAINPSFPHRMGVPNHLGAKLNPNSHEFRPNAFAPSFNPNGHPSGGSSPRSAIQHANGPAVNVTAHINTPIVISRKGTSPNAKSCNILAFTKTFQPPETKNWSENLDLRPSYDTPPTWRSVADDEKPDSTMHLTSDEFFERQTFASQPTPNPPHILPQHIPHQHQLPPHLQHVQHVGPRHSPHAPSLQMHGGQHNPMPHAPFNGADDHRMMHSNSNQSFSSPRMGHQVPMAYPAMHATPQMPFGQHMMPSFMGPGGPPQMNNFNRSLSNNSQFMPQQSGAMGAPMMMQPHFIGPGIVAGPPQMHMYAGGQPFIPPGATPQPMPGAANGYPSPRPSAPMMVPGGSSQGQVMYAQSPNMQYQQPYVPPQGQINNMRPSYNGAGSQQYGNSPQQMHQYAGPPHRNGTNNYNKNFQNHNQHHSPNTHTVPTGPQGRTSEGPDEAK